MVVIALAVRGSAAWWLPLQPDEASSLLERSWAHLMSDHEAFFNPVPWRAFTVFWGEWVMTDQGALALPLLRMPSALLGTLACLVVAAGATRDGGGLRRARRAASARTPWIPGLIAGLGMACTPWMVRQQAQFRSYGLAALAAAVVAVAMLDFLSRTSRTTAMRAGLAVGLAGWAHFVLLPWVGLWALGVLWHLQHRRLSWREAVAAAMPVALLAAGPVWLAWHGLQLKAGGGSASMAGLDELDLLWRPEPVMAVFVIALGIARGSRAELLMAWMAVGLGAWLFGSARFVETVRWGHMVAVAPALWLLTGRLVGARSGHPADRGSAVAAVIMAVAMTVQLRGALRGGLTQGDFRDLAAWVDTRGPEAVMAIDAAGVDKPWVQGRRVADGLAFELGYHRGGADRCVGPDVVHDRRCRASVCDRAESGVKVRAVRLGKTRVIGVDDAPTPLPGTAVCPDVAVFRAVFVPASAGAVARADADSVGRWRIDATPRSAEQGARP